MKKIEVGGVYRHYKGTRVKVLGEALNTETLEPMVIYIHLEGGGCWVRPKKMFLESILVNSKKTERFKRINPKLVIRPHKK